MELNRDTKRRNEILGIKNEQYTGSCMSVYGITLDSLNQLIEEEFIDLNESQNYSPTTEEIRDFMAAHSNYDIKAYGYMITPNRSDYRVTLEGIEYAGEVTMDLAIDFVNMFRGADEFDLTENGFSCWYD